MLTIKPEPECYPPGAPGKMKHQCSHSTLKIQWVEGFLVLGDFPVRGEKMAVVNSGVI